MTTHKISRRETSLRSYATFTAHILSPLSVPPLVPSPLPSHSLPIPFSRPTSFSRPPPSHPPSPLSRSSSRSPPSRPTQPTPTPATILTVAYIHLPPTPVP